MRVDPDICRDPDLLAAEVRRLQAIIDEMPGTSDCRYCGRTVVLDDDPPAAAGDPFSGVGKSAETGNIPPEWLQRPYWVDPPEGWRYGFPRLYHPATDGNMTEWMIRNGYPERLARLGLPCSFTAMTEDGEK